MRTRCFKATVLAAVLGVVGVPAHAQIDDIYAGLDTAPSTQSAKLEPHPAAGAKTGDMPDAESSAVVTLDPEAWAPEHGPGYKPAEAAPPAPPEPSPKSAKVDDKAIDLGPDEVTVPKAAPARDPLDAAKPAAPANAAAGPAKPATDTLSPMETAIKAVLDKRDAADIRGPHAGERRKEREAIAFFYAARGFEPLWSKNGAAVAAVEPVLGRLARASDDALTLPTAPVNFKSAGSLEAVAESDVELTEAVTAYARQATGSRVDPASISPLIGARPQLADPGEVLDMLAAAGLQAGDKLQALNPTDPRYVALRDKLIELHAARPTAASDLPIPAGPTLRVGMRDPRVPLIRSRFSLDSLATDPADLEYDTQVADAVADFQRANGLPPSGTLTRRTIAALSGGQPSRLDGPIIANMEMWRWMPRDLGADRIEVNVPDFLVTVYHDGEPAATHRVVVGKTETPTPLFSNTMKYLIVNPVWNVPESIIKKEFLPKSGDDPSYIAAHGFDVSYSGGRLVVKQPSGAKNALGRIKFMFPNDYSVYLHDTPSKSLFAASRRAFSHGCVRVDQPFDFAETVLNDGVEENGKMVWSKKRLNAMLGDKERYVYLPTPLPIHIEYFTASVDPTSGSLKLRDDIYGYAHKVAATLGQDGG